MSTLERLGIGASWSGARVAVLGLGRSGKAATALLCRHGARVWAWDDRLDDETEGGDLLASLPREAHVDRDLPVEEVHALVVSPGVPPTHPWIVRAESAGLDVISELELASRRLRGPVVAITGTNGKSTTVALIHAMVEAADRKSLLAGNIGTALSEVADEADEHTTTVLECSSFQLERLESFRPDVAGVLNVAPDHLDRYAGLEDYAGAKRRLIERLGSEQDFVFPAADARIRGWAEETTARLRPFVPGASDTAAAFVDRDRLCVRTEAGVREVLRREDFPLLGTHNVENALAALATGVSLGLPVEAMAEALRKFEGLPHRTVLVLEREGVRWIDDSKATNVHAARASLAGTEAPVLLLAGGRGKGEDYSSLGDFADRLRLLVAFGEEGAAIEAAVADRVRTIRCARLEDALEAAARLVRAGDTVLLSPACASFDEFSSYAQRGEFFSDWVRRNLGGGR